MKLFQMVVETTDCVSIGMCLISYCLGFCIIVCIWKKNAAKLPQVSQIAT